MQKAEFDPLDLQGQQAAKAKASEGDAHQRRTELEDLRWLMSDKRGRRFMFRLLSDSGLYRLSFAYDAAATAFNEGQRNLGLRFLNDVMEHCPERFLEMQQERVQDVHRTSDRPAGKRKPDRKHG
jgi:hypothetical protein